MRPMDSRRPVSRSSQQFTERGSTTGAASTSHPALCFFVCLLPSQTLAPPAAQGPCPDVVILSCIDGTRRVSTTCIFTVSVTTI